MAPRLESQSAGGEVIPLTGGRRGGPGSPASGMPPPVGKPIRWPLFRYRQLTPFHLRRVPRLETAVVREHAGLRGSELEARRPPRHDALLDAERLDGEAVLAFGGRENEPRRL